MKYVVLKDFKDRYGGDRHCRPGEPHNPPNEERANQLIQLGFIKAVPEKVQASSNTKTDDEVTDGTAKKRGRKKKSADAKTDGDSDGETSTNE